MKKIRKLFTILHKLYKKKDPKIYQLFISVRNIKHCPIHLSYKIINTLFYIWVDYGYRYERTSEYFPFLKMS